MAKCFGPRLGRFRVLFYFKLVLYSSVVWAQTEHHLLRRLVVFPMVAGEGQSKGAEEAWWAVREVLTQNHRFLVASREFLQQKDTYQARAELSPADIIGLGSLLDAHGIVTLFMQQRQLTLVVYDGEYGRVIWRNTADLNPAAPLDDQIPAAARRMASLFVASVPYQGFLVVDALIGKPTYRQHRQLFFKGQVGVDATVAKNDPVQIVHVQALNFLPLFLEGGRVEIVAEGHVTEVGREQVTVQVDRATKDPIRDAALLRFPKEVARLQNQFRLQDRLKNVSPNVLATEMNPVQEQVREWKPLLASLAFIGNIAAFFLLAF